MALPLALLAMKAAPAVAGLIGNLFDKKRREREEGRASAGISDLTEIFKSQLGQDYFSSAEGMGALKNIDEESDENMDQINATANVNGLTDEARIAMMGKNMQAKQGALAGLSGQSSLWRQRTLQQYGGSLQNLFSVGMNNRRNFQNNLNNVTGQMQTGIDGGINSGAFDGMFSGVGKAMKATGKSLAGTTGSAAGGIGSAFANLPNLANLLKT